MEETLKAFHVARHHVLIAGYALSVGEENPEHAADMVNHQRNIRVFGSFQQTFRQTGGELIQRFMNAGLGDFIQAGETGRHRNRVAGKGARLVNRARRRQRIHYISTTAKRAYRHPAADDFTQTGQVRHDAVVILGSGQRYAKTGHHFVDNQQRAELIAQGAQTWQKFRQRRDAVHIARYGFDDDTGDFLRILFKRRAY